MKYAYVDISERVANNLLVVGAWKGYAFLKIKTIIQRSVTTLVYWDEVELALAVTSQHFLITSA
jgi:hypothetical protein